MAQRFLPGMGQWSDAAAAGQYLVPGLGVVHQQPDPDTRASDVVWLAMEFPAPVGAACEVLTLDAALALALEPMVPLWGAGAVPPALALAVGLPAPQAQLYYLPPALALAVQLSPPTQRWQVPAHVAAQTIYRLILTGAADGVSDLELPMESFQARARTGAPTYLSAVVPDPYTYADAVAARTNGDLEVWRGVRLATGVEHLERILVTQFDRVDLDQGARQASLTVTGWRQTTNQTPARVELRGVSYRSSGGGVRRVRCVADTFLRPGDLAVLPELGGEEIEIGTVAWLVSPNRERVEIGEKTADMVVEGAPA